MNDSAVGTDPAATAAASDDVGFDGAAFYNALASVVRARNISWRQVAKETGIHPSTLTRMGQGKASDAASLAVLSAWAGINPAEFVRRRDARQATLAQPQGVPPLAAISGLLRADLDLHPEAARALERIIRVAYERFRQQPTSTTDRGGAESAPAE